MILVKVTAKFLCLLMQSFFDPLFSHDVFSKVISTFIWLLILNYSPVLNTFVSFQMVTFQHDIVLLSYEDHFSPRRVSYRAVQKSGRNRLYLNHSDSQSWISPVPHLFKFSNKKRAIFAEDFHRLQ